VFILYAIPIGILAGYLLGGHLGRLGELRLRWVPLALLGLLIQVFLFTDTFGSPFGEASTAVYVASSFLVFAALLRNVRVPGMAVAAVGAASNLLAITANGGYMPADPAGVAALGLNSSGYSSSVILTDPALPFLTDIFTMPAWMPAANIFSIGDVLLGVGVALTIALAMRGSSRVGQSEPGSTGGAPDSTGAR